MYLSILFSLWFFHRKKAGPKAAILEKKERADKDLQKNKTIPNNNSSNLEAIQPSLGWAGREKSAPLEQLFWIDTGLFSLGIEADWGRN